MAPKKEANDAAQAQRKGRQAAPDYCWVENVGVCLAALAAARQGAEPDKSANQRTRKWACS